MTDMATASGGLETVILVPVLRRPHRVAPLIENIAATTPEPHRVLFIADHDDDPTLDALVAAGADFATVPVPPPNFPAKVNFGFTISDEPLVFQAADDLRFHPGWLANAQAKMQGTVCVVGTNDLYNPRVLEGRHSTHSLLRRSYIDDLGGPADEPGRVFHEGYPHECCDDELIHVAKFRHVYDHAWDSIVEHLHPYSGKADHDEVYALGHSHARRGAQVYASRKHMWLSPVEGKGEERILPRRPARS